MPPPGLSQFIAAIRQKESGGNYNAIGPENTRGRGRATGAYQFLDSTWGKYGGYQSAYQAPPQVQDQRAAQLMTRYYNQYGSWEMAALAWHGGQGAVNDARRAGRIVGGSQYITNQQYVNDIMSSMGQGGGGGGFGGVGAMASSVMAPFQSAGNQASGVLGGGVGSPATGGGTFMNDPGFFEMNEQQAKDRAKEIYGYLGWFVDHPEVGPVLIQGAQEGWSPQRLQGALLETNWWQKTHEAQRRWAALLASDPATAKRRINETGLSIRTMAANLGVWGMGSNRLFELSTQAVANQWNEQELRLALSAEMKWRPGTSTSEQGEIGNMMQGVRAMAKDYMVPMTRKQEWQWARRMVSGAATPEAIKSSFHKLAKARFPHLSEEIDAGVTPGQYFQPYQNVIAETLETSPESIDLTSSKWREVVSYKDNNMGKVRTATLSEAARLARQQDEWMDTDNAHQLGGQVTNMFSSMFGTR